jgi:hypothetical protein
METQEIFKDGGEWMGKYYPKLKDVNQAILKRQTPSNSDFFVYEPGNGTHYEVLFSTYNHYGQHTVMTIINMRKSMILMQPMDLINIGYMREKLDLGEGDCYALIPLINKYFEELGR